MSAEHDPQATQAPVEETGAAAAPPETEQVDGVHETVDDVETAEEQAAVEVEHDLDELLARAGKADEYLALAQRTQADFENYRKRVARDAATAEARGTARLAKEILPALDNLARALEAETLDPEGLSLVRSEFTAALERLGIEEFSPEGERFDPNLHEAMAQHPVDGAEPGTVVEVYQRGYRVDGNVLRPARVVVAQ